jgi:hypothetical protein
VKDAATQRWTGGAEVDKTRNLGAIFANATSPLPLPTLGGAGIEGEGEAGAARVSEEDNVHNVTKDLLRESRTKTADSGGFGEVKTFWAKKSDARSAEIAKMRSRDADKFPLSPSSSPKSQSPHPTTINTGGLKRGPLKLHSHYTDVLRNKAAANKTKKASEP